MKIKRTNGEFVPIPDISNLKISDINYDDVFDVINFARTTKAKLIRSEPYGFLSNMNKKDKEIVLEAAKITNTNIIWRDKAYNYNNDNFGSIWYYGNEDLESFWETLKFLRIKNN